MGEVVGEAVGEVVGEVVGEAVGDVVIAAAVGAGVGSGVLDLDFEAFTFFEAFGPLTFIDFGPLTFIDLGFRIRSISDDAEEAYGESCCSALFRAPKTLLSLPLWLAFPSARTTNPVDTSNSAAAKKTGNLRCIFRLNRSVARESALLFGIVVSVLELITTTN